MARVNVNIDLTRTSFSEEKMALLPVPFEDHPKGCILSMPDVIVMFRSPAHVRGFATLLRYEAESLEAKMGNQNKLEDDNAE